MMADRYRGAIYTGVTATPFQRICQHRHGAGSDFCRRYGLGRLVYIEATELIVDAIAREKAIKKWRRAWKIELIEKDNPEWRDLYVTLHGGAEEERDPRFRGDDGGGGRAGQPLARGDDGRDAG
ncbi:GIY-YIG nuclease family protein [Sphingomonas sp.]|uniref:GIY-YIG nuclease family protein n=1 Tax=Sphingomonas sp. TaxID=28214 RepID=UPI003AFF7809